MKTFVVEIDGKHVQLGGASAARRYLKAHPEVATVERYWWDRNDLIDVETFTRVEMLAPRRATSLERGQTMRWACDHGTEGLP